MQAFQFVLDPTVEQAAVIARQFGGRRFAFNWAVETLKADLAAYHATGVGTDAPPSFYGLRARWNEAKASRCVNTETGVEWWPEVSKEAFACGVRDGVDAYWRWQNSRAGKLAGRRVGFPRYKKRGRDADRYTITTGSFGLDGRRHVKIPKVGRVRLAENARRLDRLLVKDRAKVRAMTVRRVGHRLVVTLSVDVSRHDRGHKPADPSSTVGVDAGVRTLATIATPDRDVVKVPNPRALEQRLGELRRLNRAQARRTPGSRQHRAGAAQLSKLHASVAASRRHHLNVLTTNLAKTHGRIIVEHLNVAGMLAQKGLPGARTRRRRTADAGMGEIRRQLAYKTGWYGSELVVADRWFPSSKTCSHCGHVQDIGWAATWQCEQCDTTHDRDVNAAVNLARYAGDLGTVGAPVKRGATHQTEPRSAGGQDTRKPPAGNSERSTDQ